MRVQTAQPDKESKLDQRSTGDLEAGSALSLGDIARMLLRNKWFIVACIVVCAIASLVYIKLATPIYQASASIRIDPGRAGSLGLADLTGAAMAEDTVTTEIAIIKSDAVAIDTLDSLSEDEFMRYTGTTKEKLKIPQGATSLSPTQEALLGRLKAQIGASQVPGTQLVTVTSRDPNPQIAALLVNHVIASYLHQNFASRYGSVTQVAQYLSTQMDALRERAAEAQRKLSAFQEKNNILGTDSSSASGVGGGNTTLDRLTLLNTRLASAEADRIGREAQMRAAANSSTAVLAALFPTPKLSALQAQQNTLYGRYSELSVKFGANYPPLAETKVELQKISVDLDAEIATVKSRLKEEYDSALATENTVRQQYNDQTEKAYALNRQQAEYAVLKAEGASSRELYNTLQYKLQQAGVDAGLGGVNTLLVDTARAPLTPVEPKKTAVLGFGLALGLFVGVGTVLLREATSDKVQSIDQLEQTLGYHLLTLIPHISPVMASEVAGTGPPAVSSPMLVTFNEPLSRNSEAFRTLRNSILLSSIDTPTKTVLITSTVPGEGKSNTTANFAVVMAQNGARVLVIDADLRRPTLHIRFGAKNNEGLSNLILGENIPDPFLRPLAGLDNLVLLPAGKSVALPSEALSSTKFYSLLLQWEKEFDYIILDSAPLLIVSDSLPLASWVDKLVLVTRFNMTPMSALKRIRTVLHRTNANVAGVIINDISGSGTAYGGYGYGKSYGYGYYK